MLFSLEIGVLEKEVRSLEDRETERLILMVMEREAKR